MATFDAARAARIEDVVHKAMPSQGERRAAMAWLAMAMPELQLPVDHDALAHHFVRFARDSRYWVRLCEVFRVLGLGDQR
jgi:hypothetical protein